MVRAASVKIRVAFGVVAGIVIAALLFGGWTYLQLQSMKREALRLQTHIAVVQSAVTSAEQDAGQLRSQVAELQSRLAISQSKLAEALARPTPGSVVVVAPTLPTYSCQSDPVVWANATQLMAQIYGRSPNQALVNDLCAKDLTSPSGMRLYFDSLSEAQLQQLYGIH